MRWQPGRQGTGHFKLCIFSGFLGLSIDCYLLKYPKGAMIKPHTDPVEGKKHHRLNIVLKKAKEGGDFDLWPMDSIWPAAGGRVNLFRPDIQKHAVSTVHEGTRYVLSFGLAY